MLGAIARMTMATIQTPSGGVVRQADSAAAADQETTVPIFINPKALTFPILVALVKGAWTALALLPSHLTSSIWFPFVACLALGLLVAISNLLEQKAKLMDWIFGLVIGLLNSLVIFGAVVAIPARK